MRELEEAAKAVATGGSPPHSRNGGAETSREEKVAQLTQLLDEILKGDESHADTPSSQERRGSQRTRSRREQKKKISMMNLIDEARGSLAS